MSPADFPDPDNRKKRVLPELEPAPIVEPVIDPKELAAREKWQKKQDRLTLNKMKIVIQPIMDQLKRSHRKFFKPILEESWYSYLLEEQDPEYLRSDLPRQEQEEQGAIRPWEFSKDNKGVDVLLHVESGNKYYNLDLSTIEKRLSNGYYKRPADYLFDIKTLVKDARTFGDAERTLKGNEMITNVEVDLDNFFMQQNPGLLQECEAVYQRELERERKAQENRDKAIAENKEVADIARVPPEQSIGTTETSGPITLGEPVPGHLPMPPVTPMRAPHPAELSNGTHHATNGSIAPSHDDTTMTDSQDLNATTQHDFQFQTPSRIDTQGTQTQKSQVAGRTFMAPNSHPNDYHNSASTTTSGQKTSHRSSDNKFSTQSSNGVAPVGINFSEMMPEPGGSQLPDTQGSSEFSLHFQHSTNLIQKSTMSAVSPQTRNFHSHRHMLIRCRRRRLHTTQISTKS